MPLKTAQSLAWNLAKTLMTIMVIVRTGNGYAVMPWDEFDGNPAELVREYDPFS
ncbi:MULTISPECIES: hypothetical protein [Sphingomonadales]|jgi:hypothetical protein|uniref:hypothetical protein n=1 Tax=Sphingomonadales TaxID=204457 RepID=UPI001595C94C|nr:MULTISPECIES: hypothetical protein [Sphingomonadales]MBA4757594.1 hypothetical protein [Sphingosinicella sp.]